MMQSTVDKIFKGQQNRKKSGESWNELRDNEKIVFVLLIKKSPVIK